MNLAQIYCTTKDLCDDLGRDDDGTLMSWIRSASAMVNRRFGEFIPITETRYFGVVGSGDLWVDPLLAVTTITNLGTTVSSYHLYPLNRWWRNGCYTRIQQDSVWQDEDDVVIAGRWGMYEETGSLGITASQTTTTETTITVSSGARLYPGMVILIESEQELVTGYGGYASGSAISVGNAYIVERGVNGTTAATHSSKTLSRYYVPWDINYLTRQIACLMYKKMQSGYAGKIGSAELGESFYFNEFPDAVKQIRQNYRIVQL